MEIGSLEHTSNSGEISSQKGILLFSYYTDHHSGYTTYFGAHKIINILRTKTHISNCLWQFKNQISFHLATAIPSISTNQILKTTIFCKELYRYSQIGVSCPKAMLENLSRRFLFISKGLTPPDILQISEDNIPLKYSHYH